MEPLCDNFCRTKAAGVGLVINHDLESCWCFYQFSLKVFTLLLCSNWRCYSNVALPRIFLKKWLVVKKVKKSVLCQ